VRRNVDHALAARHRLPHETLDLHAIGPVMLLDHLRAEPRRRAARRRREELRMTIERLRSTSRRLMVEVTSGALKALASALAMTSAPDRTAVRVQQHSSSPK